MTYYIGAIFLGNIQVYDHFFFFVRCPFVITQCSILLCSVLLTLSPTPSDINIVIPAFFFLFAFAWHLFVHLLLFNISFPFLRVFLINSMYLGSVF